MDDPLLVELAKGEDCTLCIDESPSLASADAAADPPSDAAPAATEALSDEDGGEMPVDVDKESDDYYIEHCNDDALQLLLDGDDWSNLNASVETLDAAIGRVEESQARTSFEFIVRSARNCSPVQLACVMWHIAPHTAPACLHFLFQRLLRTSALPRLHM